MALNDSLIIEEINNNAAPHSIHEEDDNDSISKVAGISVNYKSKKEDCLETPEKLEQDGEVKHDPVKEKRNYFIEDCYASKVECSNSSKSSRSQDTYIHEFKDEFKKLEDVRKKLASRKDKSGAVKRVVVPTYIKNSSDTRSDIKQSADYDDHIKAASVAATAAIAATQPFVKAQQDLEQQVAILNKRLQHLDDLSRYCADLNPAAIDELNAAERRLQALMQDDCMLGAAGEWGDLPPPPPLQHLPMVHPCVEEENLASLHAARKLDSLERLQKQQIVNQDRLISLTKRIDDRADLDCVRHSPPPEKSKPTAHPVTLVDNKGRKKKGNFLKKVIKQNELEESQEPRLSPVQSFPQAVSSVKALNQEIDVVRQEFNNQLKEIKQSIANSKKAPSESTTQLSKPKPEKLHKDKTGGVCPLDQYLGCQHPPLFSMEGSPPGHLASVAQAMAAVPGASECIDAEAVLNDVILRRANLENNLESVIRTKEGQVIYSLIDLLQRDENSADKARIRAMIDDAIQDMDRKVKVEVASEWQKLKLQQKQFKQSPAVSVPTTRAYMKSTLAKKLTGRTGTERLCRLTAGKYPHTKPKVDTGRLITRDRSPSPPMKSRDLSPPFTTNRRTVKTPYLHFVNELKTARRALLPLQEIVPPEIREDTQQKAAQKPRASSVRFHSPDATTADFHVHVPPPGIIPLGMRQYSRICEPVTDEVPVVATVQLSPDIDEVEITKSLEKENVQLVNLQTQTEPTKETVSMQTSPLQDVSIEDEAHGQRKDRFRMSEEGAGLQLPGYRETSPTRGRYSDPLEVHVHNRLEDEILARVLTTLAQQRDSQQVQDFNPDLLKELVEEALHNEIMEALHHLPARESQEIKPISRVSTPTSSRPSSRASYSQDFDQKEEEDDVLNRVKSLGDETPDEDKTFTLRENISTPLPSESLDEVSRRSPQLPPLSPKKEAKHIASQTVDLLPTPRRRSPSPQPPVLPEVSPRKSQEKEEDVPSSEASIETDTCPNTFSDGMWLIDRSEGEAADFICNTKTRMNLGDYPPLDSRDFELNTEMHTYTTAPSEDGEFCHATIKGHPAARDPMLNLLAKRDHLLRARDSSRSDHRGLFASPEYSSLLEEMNKELPKLPHPSRMRSPPRHRRREESADSNKSPGELSGTQQRGTFDFEDENRRYQKREDELRSSAEQSPIQRDKYSHPHSAVSPSPKVIHVSASKDSFDQDDPNELRTTAGLSLGSATHNLTMSDTRLSDDPRTSFGDPNYSESATGGLTTNQIIADALGMTGGTTMDISEYGQPQEVSTRKLFVSVPHLDTLESEHSDRE